MSTKVESLEKLHQTGAAETVDNKIHQHLAANGPSIRDEICNSLNMKVSTACGALSRLMKRTPALVEEHGTKQNPMTKRNVTVYKAVHEVS